jgi:8-oxo-dGTP diphosphatase
MAGLPHGGEWDGMTELASRPAVAVAVVTSRLGVLASRRRDGVPWTLPGGKLEPGECPEDTAVRETFEETGLRVRATGVIGSRVHPETGVMIVYVAAALTSETGAMVSAGGEVVEVRWVGVAEAQELIGDMSEPVRQYLATR